MRLSPGWSGSPALSSLMLRQTLALQAAAILLGLCVPPLSVIPLHLQSRIVDEALPAGDLPLVGWLAALWLGAVVLKAGVKFTVVWLRGWIAEIVMRVLRIALIRAQTARVPGATRGRLGASVSVMTSEVEPLGGFAAEAINTPLIQGGILLGVIGFMLVSEVQLAAIGIGALAIEAVVTPILQGRINRLTHERIHALRRAGFDLIELAEHPDRRGPLADSLHEVRRSYRLRIRMNALKALLKVMRNLIDHLAEIAVLGVGAVMVMRGETELGIVVAFLSGLRQLRDPWAELVGFYRRVADARVKYRLVHGAIMDGGLPPVLAGSAGP